ncbi:DEAD/DEAH box helicase family protein [Streptomyces griseoluteus]|uniref:DEAD/DEAH box helicase family protein n=1 Tax=Streptomyces griseoluteus TaxID=29306 RepID=UPI0036B4FD6C
MEKHHAAENAISLRPHQVQALKAIAAGLDNPPGKRIPADGLRGTVVSACGTGKTFIDTPAAQRLVSHGLLLDFVPTLKNTDGCGVTGVRAWGAMVAVCSLSDDPRPPAMRKAGHPAAVAYRRRTGH